MLIGRENLCTKVASPPLQNVTMNVVRLAADTPTDAISALPIYHNKGSHMPKPIHLVVRHRRIELELSRADCAKRFTELSGRTISRERWRRWEDDDTRLPAEDARFVAAVLGVSVSYLYSEEVDALTVLRSLARDLGVPLPATTSQDAAAA